jgi:hypothetical protein
MGLVFLICKTKLWTYKCHKRRGAPGNCPFGPARFSKTLQKPSINVCTLNCSIIKIPWFSNYLPTLFREHTNCLLKSKRLIIFIRIASRLIRVSSRRTLNFIIIEKGLVLVASQQAGNKCIRGSKHFQTSCIKISKIFRSRNLWLLCITVIQTYTYIVYTTFIKIIYYFV